MNTTARWLIPVLGALATCLSQSPNYRLSTAAIEEMQRMREVDTSIFFLMTNQGGKIELSATGDTLEDLKHTMVSANACRFAIVDTTQATGDIEKTFLFVLWEPVFCTRSSAWDNRLYYEDVYSQLIEKSPTLFCQTSECLSVDNVVKVARNVLPRLDCP